MPNADTSTAAMNPNGEPMTETRTDPNAPDNHNPNPNGPMPPDLPPDDEPIPDTLRTITHQEGGALGLG